VTAVGLVVTLIWAPETRGVTLYEASTGQPTEVSEKAATAIS